MRRMFVVYLTYFDAAGRSIVDAETYWELREKRNGNTNLDHAVAKLRGLRDSGGQGALPGLESSDEDGWDGPILIQVGDNKFDSASQRLLLPAADKKM